MEIIVIKAKNDNREDIALCIAELNGKIVGVLAIY